METINLLITDDLPTDVLSETFKMLRSTNNYKNIYYNLQIVSGEQKRRLLADKCSFPILFVNKTDAEMGLAGIKKYVDNVNGVSKRKEHFTGRKQKTAPRKRSAIDNLLEVNVDSEVEQKTRVGSRKQDDKEKELTIDVMDGMTKKSAGSSRRTELENIDLDGAEQDDDNPLPSAEKHEHAHHTAEIEMDDDQPEGNSLIKDEMMEPAGSI